MLEKLVKQRKIINCVLGGILLVLWLVTLIFGTGEDKIEVLILTPVVLVIVYGFIRLMFKVAGKNASQKYMTFFSWFFLLAGAFSVVKDVFLFVSAFPNGLSPISGFAAGLIAGVLAEAKNRLINSK